MQDVSFAQVRQLNVLQKLRKLTIDDVWPVPERFQLRDAYAELAINTNESLFLIRAVARMLWKPMIPIHIAGMLFQLLPICKTMLNGYIYHCLDSSDNNTYYMAYMAAVGMILVEFLIAQKDHLERYMNFEKSRVQDVLELEITRRPLIHSGLKSTPEREYTMAEDLVDSVFKLQDAIPYIFGAFATAMPIYSQVGWYAFIPPVVSLALTAFDQGLKHFVGGPEYWDHTNVRSPGDSIDEIYFNVKTVKMFGWERMYLDPKLKRNEVYLKQLPWYAALIRFGFTMMEIVSMLTADLSMYLTVALYLNTMPTSDAMTNSKLLEMTEHIEYLRHSINHIAGGIAGISDMVRHNNTLEPLFRCETFSTISHVSLGEIKTVPSITMDNCSFRWEKKATLLKQVSLSATGKDLIAVVGNTGSGKSSLLLAMCRELEMTKGAGTVVGKIGYMEQSPWIMNDTMRANILFGREFDEEYYWKVIHACALTRDLESWPDSDLTMIGERGINISGGQRARLALARTVYSQADIYMLDDPLSAVDAHVKRHILDNVILSSGLLGNKLRIVTTHSESMLPFCNQVITVGDKTTSVVRQEPKEHLYIAPVAAVEVNDVCEPTSASTDSDYKPETLTTDDSNAQVTTSDDKPMKCLDSDEDRLPQQKHTLLDNAKYVLKVCGWRILSVIVISASMRPMATFILNGYNIAALKENAKTNTVSHDAVLWYLKINILKAATTHILRILEDYINDMLQSNVEELIYIVKRLMIIPNRFKKFSNDISKFRQLSDIEPEAPYIVEDCRVPSEWPPNGSVEFKNLSVKYGANQDYALKNLNITIRPGEKIGIVGRTGAGKSTLAKSIFRLIHKNIEGSIEIDGHDTSKFGVGDFRPKLGIIPQESTMFRGTVKRNLDPLNEFTIEDMWAAMIKCGVADLIEPERKRKIANPASKSANTNGDNNEDTGVEEEDDKAYWDRENKQRWAKSGLLTHAVLFMFDRKWEKYEVKPSVSIGINRMVSSHGNTLSSGQQQLFSLCRLLMRKRKVMILDEATADVDLETDRKMQELIRTEFSESTVLTIAHRLDTIMNSDRIIVMEKGEIVEIGPPQELIASGGKFAELIQANEF
ncbi:Canalicular multispecific organic anion transporter 1 [Coemansia sp. RSA 455]|nr:Canalicular multispecific organic anion transporter 1 [Coemansia sp. RSA 455]